MPSGLLPLETDERDLDLGSLFSFGYTPKQTRVKMEPISFKNQKRRSNCSFQSYAGAKAIQEGRELSARYLTAKAYKLGLCGWDGWADLRSGAKVLEKFGVPDESECPSNEDISFSEYINIDFTKLDPLAEKGKIKSYWFTKSIDDVLRALDEGFPVVIGRTWLTGMNQSGGFKAPWILPRTGSAVGGHATHIIGYDLAYNGRKVDIEANSYGAEWGDNGCFYCPIDEAGSNDLAGDIAKYGAVAFLDIEYNKKLESVEELTIKYDQKSVKGNKGAGIYYLYDGKKFAYKNAEAFLSYNNKPYTFKDAFTVVPQELIDQVPFYGGSEENSLLTGELNANWEMIQNMKKPVNSLFVEK